MGSFRFEEQSGIKYIVYEKQTEDIVDEVALAMLSNNKIRGSLSFIQTQVDDQITYKYAINGLQKLDDYLSSTFTREKLLQLLHGFQNIYQNIDEYMMEPNQVILDRNAIFFDNERGELNFIILPLIIQKVDINLFIQDIITKLKFDRNEDFSFYAELLHYFNNNPEFSRVEFNQMIQKIEGNYDTAYEKNVYDGINPGNSYAAANYEEEFETTLLDSNYVYASAYNTVANNGKDNTYNTEKTISNNTMKEGQITSVEASSKKGLFSKKTKAKTNKESGSKEQKKDNGIFGGIAIPGLDNSKQSKSTVNQSEKEVIQSASIEMQQVNINEYNVSKQDFQGMVGLNGVNNQPKPQSSHYKKARNIDISPYQIVRNSTGEKMELSREITRIGRKRDMVDFYVGNNRYIGRIHAVIRNIGGKLYIEDNASKNKTYVNNRQVTSHAEIKRGDVIRLGNEEFSII